MELKRKVSKKIYIKTFGCQMNEYDSNRILDIVKNIGYEKSNDQKHADCYVINTCHIRDKAKEKVFHEVGRVKKIYKRELIDQLRLMTHILKILEKELEHLIQIMVNHH